MDAEDVSRIATALVAAIADANDHAPRFGIDHEFRLIVEHARELHDLLVEAIDRLDRYVDAEAAQGLSDRTHLAILQLEALSGPERGQLM